MQAEGRLGGGGEKQKGQRWAGKISGAPGKSPFSAIWPYVTLGSAPLRSSLGFLMCQGRG